jgi:hypothetical protein
VYKSNIMNKKKFVIFSFIAALVLVGVGCGSKTQDSPEVNLGQVENGQVRQILTSDGDLVTETDQTYNQDNSDQPARVYTSTITREKGESDGTAPYAPIDKEKVITVTVDKNGGVLETDLSSNVKMFVVVPKDSVVETAQVSILPYTKMPSGPQHPGLSNKYGYGAEVVIDSIQRSVQAYVIFDTTGGKAHEKVSSLNEIVRRCNPSTVRFNPVVCAYHNNVPPTKLINKNAGIISPIHTKQYNNLVFTRSSIPIGIDGLLVTRITQGDVFVPQAFDQALVADLTDRTFGRYTNYPEKIEAAALAMAWDVKLKREQVASVVNAIGGSETYNDRRKAVIIGNSLKKYSQQQASTATDEDEREEWEIIAEELDEDTSDAAETIYQDAIYDTERDFTIASPEAAATVRSMNMVSYAGANNTANRAHDNLLLAAASMKENKLQLAEIVYGVEATIIIEDQVDTPQQHSGENETGGGGGGLPEQPSGNTPPTDPSPSDPPPTEPPPPPQDASDPPEDRPPPKPRVWELDDIINDILNDANSTISDLLDALGTAQAMGIDTPSMEIKVKNRMRDKLNNWLDSSGCGSSGQTLNIAATAQAMGLDSVENKALGCLESNECDLVHNRTLANFGINECQ